MTMSLTKAKLEGWQAFGFGTPMSANPHACRDDVDPAAEITALGWKLGWLLHQCAALKTANRELVAKALRQMEKTRR
jgi:hypothetical protein